MTTEEIEADLFTKGLLDQDLPYLGVLDFTSWH